MNITFRKIIGLFGAVFLLCAQAEAVEYGDYVRYVRDIEYRGQIFYRNSSKEYTITAAMEDEIKPVITNMETFGQQAQRQVDELHASLYAALYDGAHDNHGEVSHFSFNTGSFPKKVSLELIGKNNGKVIARVGPIRLDVQAGAKDSWGSAIWSADMSVSTSSFYIQGEYDVYTGIMSNVNLANFTYSVNVNADSMASILLDTLLDRLADDMEEKVADGIATSLNNLASQQYKLFDVNLALPSNKYVTAAGYDIAEEVKDAINNLISGERVKFSLSREFKRYSSTSRTSPWAGSDQYVKEHELFIELGQNANTTFRIWDMPHFGWTRATECNWGECFAPNPTVDLPDTNEGWIDIKVVDLDPPTSGSGSGSIPSGASCTWSSTPSYGNGMGGSSYYEYPAIGPCTDSIKKVTTNPYGQVTIQYQ